MIVLSSWVWDVFYCSGFGCLLGLGGHSSYNQLYVLGQSHIKESVATKRDWIGQLNLDRDPVRVDLRTSLTQVPLGISDEFERGKHVFEKEAVLEYATFAD